MATEPNRDGVVLYRYRPFGNELDLQRLLDIFENNRLYAQAPSGLNDPFECAAQISFDAPESAKTESAKCQLLREGVSERGEALNRLAEQKWRALEARGVGPFRKWLLDQTGVVSFAGMPDDLLMWAHYASQHAGVCLRFEATTEQHADFLANLFPVRYQDAVPRINFYTTEIIEKLHAYVLTKSSHWAYEQEWRRIVWPVAESRYLPLPPGVISAIYLGYRVAESDRDAILSAAQKSRSCRDLAVLQAVPSPDSYSLKFVPAR
jgi:hypothetical protein